MSDLVRDTVFGQIIRLATGKKYLLYPEERSDFVLPQQCQLSSEGDDAQTRSAGSNDVPASQHSSSTAVDQLNGQAAKDAEPSTEKPKSDLEKSQSPPAEVSSEPTPADQARSRGFILVDWYSDSDPDNPQNWSMRKKVLVAGVISYLTFAVYIAAAIITPGAEDIAAYFGVSDEAQSLTLALYVLAYGTGPLLFSPLSEIPRFGRNSFYVYPYFLDLCLSVGPPLSQNFGSLLVFRFLTGFLASPALATGGASMADIFPPQQIPYAFIGWSMAAVCGPALGPTISTFAVARFDWRWSMWIQLWITATAFVAIFFGLPETSGPSILYQRAHRLRKLSGNDKLRSQSEIDQADMDVKAKLIDALIKPFEIAIKDPAVLFADVYIFLIYATYYLFFTSFPLVLEGIYGWSINSQSLAFIVLVIFIALAAVVYTIYYYFYGSKLPLELVERRLDFALGAVFLPPAGLFIHAFTSKPDISPYVGLFGIGVFGAGVYPIFQVILFYISLSYPKYAASILAGNDFMRSAGAAGLIMVGLPFYQNLGIKVADSILAAISCAFIPMTFGLWMYGDRLRARSKFAAS